MWRLRELFLAPPLDHDPMLHHEENLFVRTHDWMILANKTHHPLVMVSEIPPDGAVVAPGPELFDIGPEDVVVEPAWARRQSDGGAAGAERGVTCHSHDPADQTSADASRGVETDASRCVEPVDFDSPCIETVDGDAIDRDGSEKRELGCYTCFVCLLAMIDGA